MAILTRDELKSLVSRRDGPCVSIYMPTHRAGPAVQQDPIRLKNLLKEAEERLIQGGMRRPEALALLGPADRLLENGLFWQRGSDGLGLFLCADDFRFYRLPLALDELAVVSRRFHIKPLLPLLSGDGQFFILALSQKRVRLLQGGRYSVSEIPLDEVPTGLADALRFDDPEARFQFHTATGAPGGHGERAAAFHGHGVGTNDAKTNILRYFQKVDGGVSDLLRQERAPMVLAGVGYLLPIYRQASSYPYLMEEGIEGNPELLTPEELHRQAWTIVEPRFLSDQEAAAARYLELAGAESERASHHLDDVIPAAHHGRVETLFVALGLQRWGTYDPATNAIAVHQEPQADDEDLLDLAGGQTLLNGGAVYAVQPAQVPGGHELAAVLRY